MRVVLVDDEELVLEQLRYIMKQFDEIEVIKSTVSPVEIIEQFEELRPEVIFTDISIPEMNGLEFAERIFEISPETRIVFVTAYGNYAIDAYRSNTIDFITKPITTQKLRMTIQKLKKLGKIENTAGKDSMDCFLAKMNEDLFVIEYKDGCYIQVVGKNVMLRTKTGEYKLNHTISYWEQKLSGHNWIRCHKSYLVNLRQITKIYPMFNSTYNIKVNNCKEEVPVSRTYYKLLNEKLGI